MTPADIEKLLRARLWVARLGESDVMRWWKTDGILGADGAFVGPRVLPKTHATARARIAFAVAKHACDERHPDPTTYHLFRLDPQTEDQLDAHLVEHLDDTAFWEPVMTALEELEVDIDSKTILMSADIASSEDVEVADGASLGPAGRSLALPTESKAGQLIAQLAAGFTRSTAAGLAVPYVSDIVND